MPTIKVPASVATFIGVALMVATSVAHVAAGFLPGQDLTLVNAILAILTFVSTHVLHVQAVALAKVEARREALGPGH